MKQKSRIPTKRDSAFLCKIMLPIALEIINMVKIKNR